MSFMEYIRDVHIIRMYSIATNHLNPKHDGGSRPDLGPDKG